MFPRWTTFCHGGVMMPSWRFGIWAGAVNRNGDTIHLCQILRQLLARLWQPPPSHFIITFRRRAVMIIQYVYGTILCRMNQQRIDALVFCNMEIPIEALLFFSTNIVVTTNHKWVMVGSVFYAIHHQHNTSTTATPTLIFICRCTLTLRLMPMLSKNSVKKQCAIRKKVWPSNIKSVGFIHRGIILLVRSIGALGSRIMAHLAMHGIKSLCKWLFAIQNEWMYNVEKRKRGETPSKKLNWKDNSKQETVNQ